MIKGDRGITYVAWGKCIQEAERSSASAQAFGVKTCLITNENYQGTAFNELILIPREQLSQNFNIVNTYSLSPWSNTLWLDSDTLVVGELDFAFEMAELHGIAVVIAPHSSLRGRCLEDIPADAPEYNCGALWIDITHPSTKNFGQEWKNITENYRKKGWWSDQTSLSYAIFKLNINPYVLPLNWNFRAFMNHEFPPPIFHTSHGCGPIRIWHSRTPVPNRFNVRTEEFWHLRENIVSEIYYRFFKRK